MVSSIHFIIHNFNYYYSITFITFDVFIQSEISSGFMELWARILLSNNALLQKQTKLKINLFSVVKANKLIRSTVNDHSEQK